LKHVWRPIEGTRTGEQTLRWSIFFIVLFCVAMPNVDHYQFNIDRFNGLYQAIVYLLPVTLFFVLLHGPNNRIRNVALFFTAVPALLCMAVACASAFGPWYRGHEDRKISLSDVDVVLVHYSKSVGNNNYNSIHGIRLVLDRPVFAGLLRERKILIDVFPAVMDAQVNLADGGKTIHFLIFDTPRGGLNPIVQDFDVQWDGARNRKTLLYKKG